MSSVERKSYEPQSSSQEIDKILLIGHGHGVLRQTHLIQRRRPELEALYFSDGQILLLEHTVGFSIKALLGGDAHIRHLERAEAVLEVFLMPDCEVLSGEDMLLAH